MKRLSTLVLTACIALAASALVPQPMAQVPVATPSPTLQSALRTPADPTTPPAKAPQGLDQVVEIEAQIRTIEYYSSSQDWYIYVSDEDAKYQIRFDYFSDNTTDPTGTYNTEDFDLGFSYMYDYSAGDRVTVRYETITLTLVGDKKVGYDLQAEFKGSDGKIYQVHAVQEGLPPVVETISIVATNLEFDESELDNNYLYAYASNDVYGIVLQFAVATVGDYYNTTYPTTTITCALVELATLTQTNIAAADAQIVSKQENRTSSLVGYILDKNGVQYDLNLSFTLPEPTTFYKIDFTELTPITSNYSGFTWQATTAAPQEGTPEGYDLVALYIQIKADELVGTFDKTYIDKTNTIMGYIDSKGEKETQMVTIAEVNATTVTFDETTQTYHLSAEVVTNNGIQYDVTMFGRIGLANDATGGELNRKFDGTKDEISVSYSEMWDIKTVSVQATGVDAQGVADKMMLLFYVSEEDKDIKIPAGEYEVNSTYQPNSLQACAGLYGSSVGPSFYGNTNEEGNIITPIYMLRSGKADVKNNNGALDITITAYNSFLCPINITLSLQMIETALDNTSAAAPQTRKVIAPDGQLRIIRGEHIYNATGTLLK